MFVITDGFTNVGIKPKGPADELRVAPLNAKIFALGIGTNINEEELLDIAGSANNVFRAKKYKYLMQIAYYLGCKYLVLRILHLQVVSRIQKSLAISIFDQKIY